MNRRSFFQTLTKVGAGVLVAPSLLIPKEPDRMVWKRTPILIHKPEYLTLRYEMRYIDMPLICDERIILEETWEQLKQEYPDQHWVVQKTTIDHRTSPPTTSLLFRSPAYLPR